MSAGSINKTVNQAFAAFGLLFVFAGIYFGSLLFLFAPEVAEVEAQILKMRVEKERPIGYGDIPVDSTDPAHKNVPLYLTYVAEVGYSYQGAEYRGQLVARDNNPGWEEGEQVEAYILTDVPEDVRAFYPHEPEQERREALMVGGGMLLFGLIFSLMTVFDRRGEKKRHRELVKRLNQAGYASAKSSYYPADAEALHRYESGGSRFIGAILILIGLVFASIAGSQFVAPDGDLFFLLAMVFPLLIGLALLMLGLGEFYRIHAVLYADHLIIRRTGVWGRREWSFGLKAFYGLTERYTAISRPGKMVKYRFREYLPLHDDPNLSKFTIFSIPDDQEAWGKAREFSRLSGLPLILEHEDKVSLFPPEGEERRLDARTGWERHTAGISSADEFPAKYLRLREESPAGFVVTRSYRASLVWGVLILSIGIAATIATGAWPILFPSVMMGLIFISIGAKADRLAVGGGMVHHRESFLGRPYLQRAISFAEIERIAVDADPRRHMARSLVINGREKRITFGQSAGEAELVWIEARIKKLMGS